jgi:stage III sporulation protein AA
LLRDLIRQKSNQGSGCIAVVDEREEIFPYVHNQPCFSLGKHTDVLSGCSKTQGIEIVLRNMGPDIIAVDEITAAEDCAALLHAGWCGVRLLATAHAGSLKDLLSRPVYQPIIKSCIFDTVLIMNADKTWTAERVVA